MSRTEPLCNGGSSSIARSHTYRTPKNTTFLICSQNCLELLFSHHACGTFVLRRETSPLALCVSALTTLALKYKCTCLLNQKRFTVFYKDSLGANASCGSRKWLLLADSVERVWKQYFVGSFMTRSVLVSNRIAWNPTASIH